MGFDSVFFFGWLSCSQHNRTNKCFNSLVEFLIKYQEIEWKIKGNIKKKNTKKFSFFPRELF